MRNLIDIAIGQYCQGVPTDGRMDYDRSRHSGRVTMAVLSEHFESELCVEHSILARGCHSADCQSLPDIPKVALSHAASKWYSPYPGLGYAEDGGNGAWVSAWVSDTVRTSHHSHAPRKDYSLVLTRKLEQ